MKLLWNLVWKDFKRNKIISTVLAVFLILSAVLMAIGLRVAGTIISSLNGLRGLWQKKTPEVIRDRATQLMKQIQIEETCQRDIRAVSGGQLQRASICRAMINNPEILFLDEPTGALNSKATEQVLTILKQLNQEGMTIMTVTHDPRVAAWAKKVLYIKDGQIAACKEFGEGVDCERQLSQWLNAISRE